MMKALITGITGQDGAYLARILIDKGYEVHGTVRRSSSVNTKRIDDILSKYEREGKLALHYSDLLDSASISSLINNIEPDEVYNLAAQSHVAVSFENPVYTTQVGTLGSVSILEAIRSSKKEMKYYQASSSEMYGGGSNEKLNEESKFIPKSPYAASKVFAHNMTKIYRESYGIYAVNGILFNHESPIRGETFVTRKITKAVGRISQGIQEKLTLGNLDAVRDWGYAGDFVEGMWAMMQNGEPSDWVLATGQPHSVKDFLDKAFKTVGLDWSSYVETSESYYRPNEVDYLVGDYSKAKNKLGWEPKIELDGLVQMMVDNDIHEATQEAVLLKEGLIEPTWEYPLIK
ncbi:MAG: GDP-mannose 4,6-dehydratase [Actinobacteria bacterium]|nr:GDP-mannose 4,6-dehydratase [Actinomycetota bacterium]